MGVVPEAEAAAPLGEEEGAPLTKSRPCGSVDDGIRRNLSRGECARGELRPRAGNAAPPAAVPTPAEADESALPDGELPVGEIAPEPRLLPRLAVGETDRETAPARLPVGEVAPARLLLPRLPTGETAPARLLLRLPAGEVSRRNTLSSPLSAASLNSASSIASRRHSAASLAASSSAATRCSCSRLAAAGLCDPAIEAAVGCA